jgi:hypothetical protein
VSGLRIQSNGLTVDYQSVAVVDAHGTNAVVWHVDMSPNDSGLSRLSGAWVLPKCDLGTLKLLVQLRYLVATAKGLKVCPDVHAGLVDLGVTTGGIEAEVNRLQNLYDEQVAAKVKSTLVPPRWPKFPECIDLARPPRDIHAPANVAAALGIARWLESIALAWVFVEQQRLSRKFLHGGCLEQRPFPIRVLQPT